MTVAIPAPMQAPEALRVPFSSPDWIYELKFDGYRCMAGVEPGAVQLITKSGADCRGWFPEIVQALEALPGGPHVLDGEVAVLGPDGVADFNRLQERARRRRWYPGAPQVTYCVFDLLVVNGQRITGLPLVERKRQLELLLAGQPKQHLLYVGDLPADEKVFHAMVGAGLKIEGVMAKRKASTYQPGVRSADWQKIKRSGWQEGRIWKGK